MPLSPAQNQGKSTASDRDAILGDLRRRLARIEGLADVAESRLTFGLPALDGHLPHGGLSFGALHEIAPAEETDVPSAFGFLLALLGRISGRTPLLLILSAKKLSRLGRPHGHGLNALGLDPARLTLVEAADETEALWATEEAVRARAPAAVGSALGGKLDLKSSQRLLHAARDAAIPLLILRPGADSIPTAATRWRIAAAEGARDRFGLLTGPRWRVTLERCRNAPPAHWTVEFDHATHRFRMAAPMAGASLASGAAAAAFREAG